MQPLLHPVLSHTVINVDYLHLPAKDNWENKKKTLRIALHVDGCHLKSGRARVCNAWPLGEAPRVPVIVTYLSSQLEAGAAKLALYLFWYWSAPASLPGLRFPPPTHPCTMQTGVSCAAIHIHVYACVYNIHTETSKLCARDIYFISNIFKCIVTHIYQKHPEII